MMISGLQAAFLMFHNAVADRVEATTGLDDTAAFEEARRLVRWHWQWIILNEYLPQIVSTDDLDRILDQGPEHFGRGRIQIPVEFRVPPTGSATQWSGPRNLLRHITWQLPSGQTIADDMGVPRLSAGDLFDIGDFGASLDTSTPLWFCVLREAEVIEDGLRLGPVGGRIVAEAFVALLLADPTSFLGADRSWVPMLPSTSGDGEFRMTDLLTLAGVDPTSRGQ